MSLKLSQLETFYWVARLGTFRAAARRLNLAQPTLSIRMRELEQRLGIALFEREGRKVRLTADGMALLSYAENVISLTDHIEARIGRKPPLTGVLRMGAPDSFAMICLPDLLRQLEQVHPKLEVDVTVDTSISLVKMLENGQIDLAFYMDAEVSDPTIRVDMLGTQELAWVGAPSLDLPWQTMCPADLILQQVITNRNPSQLYLYVRRWFEQAALTPPRLSSCNDLNVIARLTACGLGISILPVPIVREDLELGRLRRLDVQPAMPRSIMFVGCRLEAERMGYNFVIAPARQIIMTHRFLEG